MNHSTSQIQHRLIISCQFFVASRHTTNCFSLANVFSTKCRIVTTLQKSYDLDVYHNSFVGWYRRTKPNKLLVQIINSKLLGVANFTQPTHFLLLLNQ